MLLGKGGETITVQWNKHWIYNSLPVKLDRKGCAMSLKQKIKYIFVHIYGINIYIYLVFPLNNSEYAKITKCISVQKEDIYILIDEWRIKIWRPREMYITCIVFWKMGKSNKKLYE